MLFLHARLRILFPTPDVYTFALLQLDHVSHSTLGNDIKAFFPGRTI